MNTCDRVRVLLSESLDTALAAADVQRVDEHLSTCEACRIFADDLHGWHADATDAGSALEPPDGLEPAIATSPCHRWLSLLFEAVDRQISESNLERLLGHLDGCDSCRDAWIDLTLLHQIGEALEPTDDLVERCVRAPRRRRRPVRILQRRTAAAAAYVLAVAASLAIGNPVLIARTSAPDTVHKVATDVGAEVVQVASDGRGEARVMLWRTWRAVARGAEAVRDFLDPILPDRRQHDEPSTAASADGGSDDTR